MADLYIHYGKDMQTMTYNLMKRADIASRLPKAGKTKVCIKPNLVVSRPAEGGATTHPEIVEGILQYLQDHGVEHITIAEGSWVGDSTRRAFEVCGYNALAKRYGVRIVDTKSDGSVARSYQGYDLKVCNTIAETDYLINVPVLKGHCQTDMTCCLKNLKGCIPDSEKRRFHSTGLHKPIAALNTALRADLHIIDSICGDLTFEEGGNPVDTGRILLGFDPVLLDSYCARLMGYHPNEIDHLRHAREYGVGVYANETTRVVELNKAEASLAPMPRSGTVKRLAAHIEEDSACSACYAALIFALNKVGGPRSGEKIKIGQGFRGKPCGGIGVGVCTAGCEQWVKGCPPSAHDIVEFLDQL